MGAVIELPLPWQMRALDRMLDYKRCQVQALAGVGTRDVQAAYLSTLLHLQLVDRAIVICPKVLFCWWEGRSLYKTYNSVLADRSKFDLISSVKARQHSSFNWADIQRTAFVIDIGVSGRHTAAALNHELRAAPWVSARRMQNSALTDRDPILVTPVPLGQRLVMEGISVGVD